MKITLLARYGRLGASSRLRCHDLVPLLESRGIACRTHVLFPDSYVEALYQGWRYGAAKVTGHYADRWQALRQLPAKAPVLLQVEALPFLPYTVERRLLDGRPYLLDCDDAWFHRYDQHHNPLVRGLLGRKIDRLMAGSACVLAGNHYVAERARASGAASVEILPTTLDVGAYDNLPQPNRTPATVGWIGAPQNCAYLTPLLPALKKLQAKEGLRLRVVSASKPDLGGLDFDFEPWNETTEIASIGRFDIGIMPLPDSPWERGKSGFKLVQYLAAGRAAIASPVGENRSILADPSLGILASSPAEWKTALTALAQSAEWRLAMGRAARTKARATYDRSLAADRLATIIKAL